MGWEPVLYSYSLQYPSFLFPGTTQFSEDAAPDDLIVHTCINSIHPVNWIFSAFKIKREKADLHIWCFWLPFMGPALGTMARIVGKFRHIGLLHNVIPHEKRMGDRAFSRWFLGPMTGFVAMSEAVIEDLKTFNTSKPHEICPHPLYDNFGAPINKEKAMQELGLNPTFHYLLFFGFVRAYKGLDLLLDALALPEVKALPIKLIVAGEFYQDSKPYLAQIKRLGIEESLVLHTDFIPNEKVSFYFSAADLVVQPYKTATQSGVTQIAYHFNVPMVVTNVSGLPENVPDGVAGFVVEPNAKEVGDAIVRFFKEGKAAEFKAGMLVEQKKYSWEKMVNTFLRVAKLKANG